MLTMNASFHRLSRWSVLLAVVVAALSPAARAAELVVMSYNLRYASDTPPNAWPDRRPLVRDVILKYAPDVIGTQEGVFRQLKDLATDLPAYEWVGLGRDGGSRGEFMAVFYRRDRFEVMAYDHFWLSDTPDVIASSTWGNTNRRMVTTVTLRDRATGEQFHVWNTHLDHALQPAREKGAALIRQRLEALGTDLPVLLVGDFNAVAGKNPAYDLLTREGFLQDTWTLAAERRNEAFNTFNGFGPAVKKGERIDWILVRSAKPVTVKATEVVTDQPNGHWPSDHLPVVTWLTLPR